MEGLIAELQGNTEQYYALFCLVIVFFLWLFIDSKLYKMIEKRKKIKKKWKQLKKFKLDKGGKKMDGELIRFAVMSAMGILCLGTILDFIYALVKIWLEHRVQKK